MRSRLLGAAIYLCAAGACYWQWSATRGEYSVPVELKDILVAFVSPLLYLLGACLLWRTRWAHAVALLGSLIAWPNLYRHAFAMTWSWYGNPWLVQNAPAGYADEMARFGRLLILAVAFVSCATLVSLLRLCPDRWAIRRRPLTERTWPALAVTFVAAATWFVSSARLYYVPIHGADGYHVRVVRAEKRGFSYREKIVAATRDGALSIADHARGPFEFRSVGTVNVGPLPPDEFRRIREIARRPEAKELCWKHKAPSGWISDTWYVWFEGCRFSFSQGDDTPLFREITAWAEEARQLPTNRSRPYTVKDICLGFCYDPAYSIGPPRR